MRGRTNPKRSSPGLRVAAVLLVIAHLAALSCLAAHHHANPNDTAPCLVCAGVSAPAAQLEQAPAPVPPAAPTGSVVCFDESPDQIFLPGSAGIRAPPAS